jgi:hypothetical protein
MLAFFAGTGELISTGQQEFPTTINHNRNQMRAKLEERTDCLVGLPWIDASVTLLAGGGKRESSADPVFVCKLKIDRCEEIHWQQLSRQFKENAS